MVPETTAAPFDVAATLAAMTPEEKASLCAGRDFWSLTGVERLGVPGLLVADGPHGLRKEPDTRKAGGRSAPATCFPTASALAASWDPALVREVGVALGEEACAQGVSVLLGPGVNIKRTPLCGRNFEYFSEDPLLSARLGASWIAGVQSQGVAASLKHFAVNNQEERRYTIDALVDERALREIYLSSFEGAVAAGRPWTLMTAYNRVNGVFCSEHEELLAGVLRGEWGFDGVVLSDWGATADRIAGLRAGLDLEMPGYRGHNDHEIVRAAGGGRLPVEALDEAVGRLLTLVARTARAREGGHRYDQVAHHELARRAAEAGTVLLRNEGALLPLTAGTRVAVVGAFAAEPRYQGAGSSNITPHRVEDALTAINAFAEVTYAPGYARHSDVVDSELLGQALEAARGADVVLVFAGLPEAYESEGRDRVHARLPASHDALITAVAEVNPQVVVVLSNGAPVEMPWHEQVAAVVEGYLGGQAGGSAIARVLFGAAEPGGRLAETFPLRWEDHPVSAIPTGPHAVEYRESVHVGYRYYDRAGAAVCYPFGHGLSYTSFAFSDLAVSAAELSADDGLDVSITITNTGARRGSEVVQVYVSPIEPAVFRPEQELRGFAKAELEPGESTRVACRLERRAFARYSLAVRDWVLDPGRYEIRVGASSRDIRLVSVVTVVGPPVSTSDDHDPLIGRDLDRAAFARLYGRPLPANAPPWRGTFTLDTPLADMHASLLVRVLHAALRYGARRYAKDSNGPMAIVVRSVVADVSLRMMILLTGARLSRRVLEVLLAVANGRYLGALRALFGG